MTLAVVAWGYLVYAAIDFGATARDGNPDAWWFLAVASLGAVACLFVGLMLIARLLRRLGITGDPQSAPPAASSSGQSAASSEAPSTGPEADAAAEGRPIAPRSVGGRRAAR